MTEHASRPAPADEPSSHDLLDRFRSGDEAALQALLVRHMGTLRAFVRLQITPYLRAREAESDVVQSVCREILARVDRFEDRGETAFRAWLYGAVHNKIREQERRHKAARRTPAAGVPADPSLLSAYESLTPSEIAMDAERARALEEAFRRIEPGDAELLSLHHFAGLSPAELADHLGITADGVRKRLRRATVRISRYLVKSD